MKIANSIAIVALGSALIATNACATTITYDFIGSGDSSHAAGYRYSLDHVTGVETSDYFNETDTVNIHSTFVLDTTQYQDAVVPQSSHFTSSDTFGQQWLSSYSTANAGSHSSSLSTAGNYGSYYTACDSLSCYWGGNLVMFDEGVNNTIYTYYDSGAVKSMTKNHSYNQAIATSFDLLLSRVDGQYLVTHIGDLSGYNDLFQTITYYTDYYDELGNLFLTDGYVSEFRAPLTSVNISVDPISVPEPAPFILFGLGFLMISAQRIARKN